MVLGKKKFARSSVAILLSLLITTGLFPAKAENESEVTNGNNGLIFSCGFEEPEKLVGDGRGEVSYDSSFPESYKYNTYSLSSDSHSGSYSLEIAAVGNEGNGKRDSRVPFKLSLENGKYYKISGFFKLNQERIDKYIESMTGKPVWPVTSLVWGFSTSPNGGYKQVYVSTKSDANDYTKYLRIDEWVPSCTRTKLFSDKWTEVETVVKADGALGTSTDYYFWVSLNDVNTNQSPMFVFADDITVSEVNPTVVFDGDTEIDIPSFGEQVNSVNYTARVAFSDVQSLSYESIGASYSLDGEYEGITFDKDTHTLSVADNASAGDVKINFTSVNGFEGSYTVHINAKTTVPEARNTSVSVEGDIITVDYLYYDPYGKTEGDSIIKWYASSDNGKTYTLIPDAASKSLTLDDELKSMLIKVSVVPMNSDSICGIAAESSPFIFNPVAPVASNVAISGKMKVGEKIRVTFNYYDANSDAPGEHIYKWYTSFDGVDFDEMNVSGSEYMLTDSDENMYIKAEVTPISQNDPVSGECVQSEVFGPVEPAGDELAVNGGFENFDLITDNGYDEFFPSATASNVNIKLCNEPENVYSGENSLYVTVESGSRTTGIEFTPTVKKNTLYIISFKAKKGNMGVYPYICPLNGTKIFVDNLSELDKADEYGTTKSHIFLEGERFIDVSKVFFVPDSSGSTETTKATLRMLTGREPSTSPIRYYIDDLSITEAAPTVKLNGSNSVVIPAEGQADEKITYNPEIYLKNGERFRLAENLMRYTLAENYEGVTLDGNTLTVSDGASSGIIYLTAKNDDYCIRKSIPVRLVYNGEPVPMVKKLLISGSVTPGAELKAVYAYFHGKNVPEDKSKVTYKWQYSDAEDGIYEDVNGADSSTYVVPEDKANGYFKVRVLTYDINGVKSAEAVSPAAVSPTAPTAENVSINGRHSVGATITASYDFEDKNHDVESESIYKWYISDSEYGDYTVIDGENTLNYIIKEGNCGKFIKFSVTPHSASEPNEVKEYFSNPFEGPVAPYAKNVKIIGSGKVGSVLSVSYEYEHKYGVAESVNNTVINWYADSKMISAGTSLKLTNAMEGKIIYAGVIPASVEMPYLGAEVKSDSISVESGGSNGYGGGSGSKRGGGSTNVVIPSNPTTPTVDGNVFSDAENHWAGQTILNMYKKKIIDGVGNGMFEPDRQITKAEFCTVICKAFDVQTDSTEEIFSDVSNGSWYAKFVCAAAKSGIIKGSDGLFNPNKGITREEMASVMMNLLMYKKYDVQKEGNVRFSDEDDISDWAKEAVNTLCNLGLLKGKDGQFAPKDSATRAEAVTVVERLLQIIE